jgi:hypothetical protein
MGEARQGYPVTQRAVVAMNLLLHAEARARARQAAAGGANPGPLPAKLPGAVLGDARDEVADIVGVSPRYVSDVKRLITETPALGPAMLDNIISITEAKAIATLPPARIGHARRAAATSVRRNRPRWHLFRKTVAEARLNAVEEDVPLRRWRGAIATLAWRDCDAGLAEQAQKVICHKAFHFLTSSMSFTGPAASLAAWSPSSYRWSQDPGVVGGHLLPH